MDGFLTPSQDFLQRHLSLYTLIQPLPVPSMDKRVCWSWKTSIVHPREIGALWRVLHWSCSNDLEQELWYWHWAEWKSQKVAEDHVIQELSALLSSIIHDSCIKKNTIACRASVGGNSPKNTDLTTEYRISPVLSCFVSLVFSIL